MLLGMGLTGLRRSSVRPEERETASRGETLAWNPYARRIFARINWFNAVLKPAAHSFATALAPARVFRNALTDHTESARPIRKATKESANTEWLKLAPKYCQKAAPAPG